MGNQKSLALLALLFSLSLTVFADTSNDAAIHAKDEVKPSTEATDAIEPQLRDHQPQIPEAEVKANDVVVEPQQGWGGGGCRYGCCGGWWGGRCRYCCSRSQAVEAEAVEANVVDPQQDSRGGGGRGGCRYGCCSGWWRGRCRYCCSSQAEVNEVVETVEPQRGVVEAEAVKQGWGGGGCRFGCCGGWWRGRCRYCCSRPQAEADVVDPQQRRGCRFGCCGSYAYGQCSACCSKKIAMEEDKKEEEAKP